MSNCQKEVKSQAISKVQALKSNFELSSKYIFTQNPNPKKKQNKKKQNFLLGWVGRDWSQESGGAGAKQNCKITNMSYHIIHVHNI